MSVRIQLRRDTAANWASANPVLLAGEIGLETDTLKFKIGSGTNWNSITSYANITPSGLTNSLGDYILLTEKGEANGVAELDANGLVPTDQLPLLTKTEIFTAADQTARLALTAQVGDFCIQTDNSTVYGLSASPASTNANWKVINQVSSAMTTLLTNVQTAAATDATTKANAAQSAAATYTDSAISTEVTNRNNAIASEISTHNSDTTSVHGIPDTSVLVTATDLSNHATDTTSIHGITDTADLVTKSGTQTLGGDKTFTGTVTLASTTSIGDVSATEIGYVNGVTSAIQTQLDAKANLAGGATFTGTISLPGTTSIGDVSSTEISYLNNVTSAVQTQLDAKVPLSGGTMTGYLTLSGAPTSSLHAATKGYVDDVTAGLNFHEMAHAATTENLSATYNNGTSGVGATLTASSNGFLSIDGHSMNVNDRVLVKDQSNKFENGIYYVSNAGGVSAAWVLTRATDADNSPSGEVKNGDFVFVRQGTVNGGFGFIAYGVANPLTIGTDNIEYTSFNTAQAITAGTGLTESPTNTFNVNTSVIAPLAGPTFTGTVTLPATTSIGTVTSSEIGYLSGVTSAIQTQMNAKAPLASPALTGTPTAPTASVDTNTTQVATTAYVIGQSYLKTSTAASTYAPINAPTFTGLVTVAASGVAFTDGTQTKQGVPSITPIIQKTASYKLSSLTERDSLIEVSSTSPTTITIPTDSGNGDSVNYPVGTSIDILQTNTGQITVAGDSGVTLEGTPGKKLRTQWSSATIFKRAANYWVVYGDLTN